MCNKSRKMMLRHKYLEVCRNLSENEKKRQSEAICRQILDMYQWKEAGMVLLYIPMKREVDISLLFEAAWSERKAVILPKCMEAGRLDLYEIMTKELLVPGMAGILEPDPKRCRKVEPDEIDLAVIPVVAVDRKGYRLGNGGGYYDRLLPRLSFSLAVGFICQLAEELPIEKHDARVSGLVLPDRTEYWG